MPALMGTLSCVPGCVGSHIPHIPCRGICGFPNLHARTGCGDVLPCVLGWCGLWGAGALDTASQPDPHGVVAPRAYLEVHQLELEKLSTQIRESKRNSRLVSASWEEPYGEWCFG